MKKKQLNKLFKISSALFMTVILISSASFSASAEEYLRSFDLSQFTVLSSSGVTRSVVTSDNVTYTRFSSPSGSDGILISYSLSNNTFNVGQEYKFVFKTRSNANRSTLNVFLANSNNIADANIVFNILTIDSKNYTSGHVNDVSVSFKIPDSLNGQQIWIFAQFNSNSSNTVLDVSSLKLYNLNPIPDSWESPTYSLSEPDLIDQIDNFQENQDTFFEIDWFRQSNPVGNGAKAFLGLFSSVWTQFDRAPWLKLMVTFAIMTSLVGLIINSATHIRWRESSPKSDTKSVHKKD